MTWYPAVFDVETVIYGEFGKQSFREVVRKGAFANSLSGTDDIIANLEHDRQRTFAHKTTGELLLQEDDHGLFASVYLGNSPLEEMIKRDIEAGVLKGGSFRARVAKDNWQGDLCEVVEAPLIDVTVTANPYYSDTDIRLRTKRYIEFFRRLRILKAKG